MKTHIHTFRRLTALCCLLLFFSCKTEQKKTPIKKSISKTLQDTIQQDATVAVKNKKTPVNPIYEAADRLNMVLFGKKLKHFDFTVASEKIPNCVTIFDFKELVKIRAFLEPKFNKNYVPNYLDKYVYFIFEYPNEEIAQKIIKQYAKESEIIRDVDTDETPFEALSARQKQISYNSKHGGIIFNSNQNIIFVKEDCNEPNTKIPMQWSTYEKVFLNSFEHHKKDSIIGTICGFSDWDMYTRK